MHGGKHADAIAIRALGARGAARESLPSPWRKDPIIDAIDEIVAEFAEVLRRAADEQR